MTKKATYGNKYCLDCGVDTFKTEEYYIVQNDLWRAANPKILGMLCTGCLEKRLGRELCPSDFTSAPVNEMQARVCDLLFFRLYGIQRANTACS